MTRALARDLGDANIRVNCVVPGAIRTPRQMKLWHTPEEEAKILAQQCLKQRVDPVHVTAMVLFLASGDAACARRTTTGSTAATADADEQPSECVWPVGAVLGEGPVWSAAEQAVWFVDIKAPAIHRFHPASGAQRSWPAPARVGFLLPTRNGWLIAGLKTGLHSFNPETGNFTLLHVVEPHAPNNRLNDGFVDCGGFPVVRLDG